MKAILITSFFFLLQWNVSAQVDTVANQPVQTHKNTIYGTVGFLFVIASWNLTYERKLLEFNQRNGFVVLRGSCGQLLTWGGTSINYILAPHWIFGKRNSRFETGLGLLINYERDGYRYDVSNANFPYPNAYPKPDRMDYINFLPAVTIGYRYQKYNKPFVFRTGLGIPESFYLSMGVSF